MEASNSQTSPGYTLVLSSDEETAPPAYEVASSSNPTTGVAKHGVSKKTGGEELPSYENATSLPSYEEIEVMKEDEARQEVLENIFGVSAPSRNEPEIDGFSVGNDCMFMFGFVLAFFFNWLGFFIGYCILLNLAARYGAISGFGLSICNWLVYLKYSKSPSNYLIDERIFMWWFFLLIASLLFLKGLINWVKIRRILTLSPEQRENGHFFWIY